MEITDALKVAVLQTQNIAQEVTLETVNQILEGETGALDAGSDAITRIIFEALNSDDTQEAWNSLEYAIQQLTRAQFAIQLYETKSKEQTR